ncbi:MAG: hypothetical protein BWY52_02995 [Chloroflexi bacterium ADurb.Bin325]|nr:MAG: hypothetical protein BWY52_02995 [Chloroflexi bacterium ADurb.Bin325]
MQINWPEILIGGIIGSVLTWLGDNVVAPRVRKWWKGWKQRLALRHYREQATPMPPDAFQMYTLGNIQVPVMNLVGSPETPFTLDEVHIEYRPTEMDLQQPDYPGDLKAAIPHLTQIHKQKHPSGTVVDNPLPRLIGLEQAGETIDNKRGNLTLTFGLTTFCTFLATNRSLDYAAIPKSGLTPGTQTIREAFVRFPYQLGESVLANPLGAHMLLISRSTLQNPHDQVIIRQRSSDVALYKEAFQVSSSGFLSTAHCDAGGVPNPFVTAVVEAREELSHLLDLASSDFNLLGITVNWEDLDLNAYGYAETGLTVQEILGSFRRDDFETGKLLGLPFNPETLLAHIMDNKWEPVSVVTICAVLLRFFPQQRVLEIARRLPARKKFWDYYEHSYEH